MKFCAWCGNEVHEEQGSHEVREFFRFGKLALYFCDDICQLNYYNDKVEHGGRALDYVTERGES